MGEVYCENGREMLKKACIRMEIHIRTSDIMVVGSPRLEKEESDLYPRLDKKGHDDDTMRYKRI